jgi:peptidoglycan/LPS O-acetylase OafA/YrhL
VFVQLGDASYTIYLGHLIFLAMFYLSGLRTFLSGYGHPLIELGFLAFIAASLIFSVMIYRCFEKPLYKFVCSVRLAQLLGFIKPEHRFS